MPMVTVPSPAPAQGFRDASVQPDAFLSRSRNFSMARNAPVTRPGYVVRRSQPEVVPGPLPFFLERIPADEADGTIRAAVQREAALYTDAATPVLLETLSVDPYAAIATGLPSWVHAYGRTALVNGTDFRILIAVSGVLTSKPPLPDPANPTLAPVAGGTMTQVTWFVRIRWYDNDTQTYSGPNSRTGNTVSQALSGGNSSIQVTRPSNPARATHWQIQLVATTDTPSGYEITFETHTSGLIPIATTNVTLTQNPASGERFEFRSDAAQTLYRHSNPPTGAGLVMFHRGRWFYASRTARWLIWTDVGNPEHFFNDPVAPEAGFNTADGDGIGNSISGPCTGLFSNQLVFYFAQRNNIQVGEGSWEEVFDESGLFINRQGRISPLTSNGMGAVAPSWIAVDEDIYFVSPRGPAIIADGVVSTLDQDALRVLWASRERDVDHRMRVSYEVDTDTVLFSLCSQAALPENVKVPDLLLAWQRARQLWCPPWTIPTTGMSLMRFATDAGVDRGLRVVLGSWWGQQLELGLGDGDGWDGSNADAAAFNPNAVTPSTVTKTGAGWSTNAFSGFGLVLVSPAGIWHYRQIRDNAGEILTWVGDVPGLATTWRAFLGGIPSAWHTAIMDAQELTLRAARLVLDDQPSRKGA